MAPTVQSASIIVQHFLYSAQSQLIRSFTLTTKTESSRINLGSCHGGLMVALKNTRYLNPQGKCEENRLGCSWHTQIVEVIVVWAAESSIGLALLMSILLAS